MDILVSIIVLVYRVEDYLDECVQSLLAQTYTNLEIILVDDGSDDRCPQMCDDYAKQDSRIKVVHKKNGGIDEARKYGIQAATGDYVGYVDSDDWVEPNMFERLVYFATKYNVSIVEAGIIDAVGDKRRKRVPIFDEGVYKGERFLNEIAPKILYSGDFFRFGVSANLVTKLMRRDLITKYQMMPEPSQNIVDDTMCAIPCVAEAQSLYVTHECYYYYRIRENSAKRMIRPEVAKIIGKCYPDWKNRFTMLPKEACIEKQIQYYLLYLLLMKAIHIFDDPESEKILTPYGNITKNDKLVLYGAGATGVYLENYITNIAHGNMVFWADAGYKEMSKTIPVGNPKDILTKDYDYVIISILMAHTVKSAKNDLIELGVPEEKILWIKDDYLKDPKILLGKAKEDGKKIVEDL